MRTASLAVPRFASAAALMLAVAPIVFARQATTPRVVHTDPAAYRPLTAVHGGAGNMAYTALLNRGAIGPQNLGRPSQGGEDPRRGG